MAEMERRRNKQLAYNEVHGIQPKSIQKAVPDIMEGARPTGRGRRRRRQSNAARYTRMSPQEVVRRIEGLERRMYQHARDLEFEEAAKIRDEISEAREAGLARTKRQDPVIQSEKQNPGGRT